MKQSSFGNHPPAKPGANNWSAAWLAVLLLVLTVSGDSQIYGDEIDRLLVAVNGKVITEGDLKLARSVNAILLVGKSSTTPSREAEISRLIDLELLRQELTNFNVAQEDESTIEARMRDLRNAGAEVGGLPALLSRLGLQESEVVSYLRLEASILKFVNFRFRPFVSVSEEEIKTYYQDRLIPQLQKSGARVPPLAEVSSKIDEILREEKVNSSLEQWIQDIRRHSRIEYFPDSEAPVQGGKW